MIQHDELLHPRLSGVAPSIVPFRETCWGSLYFKILLLVAFVGLFLSIMGSLTCDFLGQQQQQQSAKIDEGYTGVAATTAPTTDNIFVFKYSSQIETAGTQQVNATDYSWLGIFSYQSVADKEEEKFESFVAHPKCIQHDHEYMFGDAPYRSLIAAQVCAMLAPIFCILSLALIFLEAGDICRCQYNRRLSGTCILLLIMASWLQEVPLIMFLDSQICEDLNGSGYPCIFGQGAWYVVASGLSFLAAAVLLVIYYWTEDRYDGKLFLASNLDGNSERLLKMREAESDTETCSDDETVRPRKRASPRENLVLMHMKRNVTQNQSNAGSWSGLNDSVNRDAGSQINMLRSSHLNDIDFDSACGNLAPPRSTPTGCFTFYDGLIGGSV